MQHSTNDIDSTISKFSLLKIILPDVSCIATMFWSIIQSSPYGSFSYIMMLIFQHFSLMGLATRLSGLHKATVINDDIIYGGSEQLYVTLNIALAAIFAVLLIAVIYIYISIKSCVKKNLPISCTLSKVSLSSRLVSILMGGFPECLGLVAQCITTVGFYKVNDTSGSNATTNLILLSFAVFNQCQIVAFSVVARAFLNLEFQNDFIPWSRMRQGIYSDYMQQAFSLVVIYMCLKPQLDQVQISVFLSLITVWSVIQYLFIETAMYQSYFSMTMQRANFFAQAISSSFYSALLALTLINFHIRTQENAGFSTREFLMIWITVFLLFLGIATILKRYRDNHLIDKISATLFHTQHFESSGIPGNETPQNRGRLQKIAEHGLYIINNYLESHSDCLSQIKFLSFILGNEELVKTQNELSYYMIVSRIMEQTIHYEDEEEQLVQPKAIKKEESCIKDLIDQFSEKRSVSKMLHQQLEYTHGFSTEIGLKTTSKSEDDPQFWKHHSQFDKQSISAPSKIVNPLSDSENIKIGSDVEPLHQLLTDIFMNELISGKYFKDIENPDSLSTIGQQLRLLHIDTNATQSEEQAVGLVKIRFFYDVIVNRFVQQFPGSIKLLYFKALLAIEKLQNQYLTLTIIAHINLYSQRNHGYIEKIITKVAESFFMHKINSMTQKSINKDDPLSNWIDNEKVINTNSLMEQNFEIDRILNKIQKCTIQIAEFWQVLNQDDLGPKQFSKFLDMATGTTKTLQDIKSFTKRLDGNYYSEIGNGDQSNTLQSYQLRFTLSQFFNNVLRDHRLAMKVSKQFDSGDMYSLRLNIKDCVADSTGVMLVDGNFDLYGRIIFGNKVVLKLLGYRVEEVGGKLIHMLMPACVAEVHNNLWRGFTSVGEPKVLDQVRFLYAKDCRGYITPLKVFIKFQYTARYGYSFVGLFKPPYDLIMQSLETPIPIQETYHLLCNSKGVILELSQSCKNLLRLTPRILEKLHSTFEESFCLSMLNMHELQIADMDFESHSCQYFRSVVLDLSKIYSYIDAIEVDFEEDAPQSEELNRTFQAMLSSRKFRAQMKIIKESYGVGVLSEPLDLYYVVFAEAASAEDVTMNMIEPKSAELEQSRTKQKLGRQDSNNSVLEGAQNSQENQSSKNSTTKQKTMNASQESPSQNSFRTRSDASQSASVSVESQIHSIDEDIDGHVQTPRTLKWLEAVIFIILLIQIVLSSTHFILTTHNDQAHQRSEAILFKTIQSKELLTEITLLSRAYINVNLGLEPSNSQFIQIRQTKLKKLTLNLIESLEHNIQDIKEYYVNKASKIESKDLLSFDLLPNSSIQVRELPQFYLSRYWIVQIQQIFNYPIESTSSVGTFLLSKNSSLSKMKAEDLTTFYIFVNEQGLKNHIDQMIGEQRDLINKEGKRNNTVNQLFTIVSSCLIVLSAIGLTHLAIRLVSFKYSIFQFFDQLPREQTQLMEQSANEFMLYLDSGDPEQLNKVNSIFQKTFFSNRTVYGFEQTVSRSNPKEEKNSDKEQDIELPDCVVDDSQRIGLNNNGSSSGIESENNENEDEEVKEEEPQSPKKIQNKKKVFGIQEPEVNTKEVKRKKKKKQGSKKKSQSKSSIERVKEQSSSKKQLGTARRISQLDITVNLHQFRLKQILKPLIQRTVSMRILPLSIFIAALLIAYFVIQYWLLYNQSFKIESNQNNVVDLLDSLECQSEILLYYRTILTSNRTRINVDQSLKKDKAYPKLNEVLYQDQQGFEQNESFTQCIRLNQKMQTMLLSTYDGQFTVKGNQNDTICNKIHDSLSELDINETACYQIYQGALLQSPLQSTSLIMQDLMQQVIRFVSADFNRSQPGLLNALRHQGQLELQDTHIFFLQNGLRNLYQGFIEMVLSDQGVKSANVILFAFFLSIMLIAVLLTRILILNRIQKWYWSSLYLMQLLPRDDLDIDFIRNINDVMRKA